MKEGVIILGHGSRREDANEEIRLFTEKLGEKDPEREYQVAFLELADPSLDEAIEKLLNRTKLEKVIIMPMFLTVGNHMHRNIPDKIWKLQIIHPHVKFALAPHLGLDYRMMDIVHDRIRVAQELEQGIIKD